MCSASCAAHPTARARCSRPATTPADALATRRPRRRAHPLRHRTHRGRRVKRIALTLVVTGLCTAYILWKIDLGKTGHVLATAHVGWWLLSLGIMVALGLSDGVAVAAAARRARRARLARRGSSARTSSATRPGQVLPTALGGDASRIYETVRRHEGSGGAAAGHRAARARARRRRDARARRGRLRARGRPVRRRRLSLGRARVRRRLGRPRRAALLGAAASAAAAHAAAAALAAHRPAAARGLSRVALVSQRRAAPRRRCSR